MRGSVWQRLLPRGEGGRRPDEGICNAGETRQCQNPHPNPLPEGEGTISGTELFDQLQFNRFDLGCEFAAQLKQPKLQCLLARF